MAIEVNQATIARFEDGLAWPRQPEEVLMAYASARLMPDCLRTSGSLTYESPPHGGLS